MYIWEKEIKEIKWTTVLFEDGTKEEFTETNLKYLQTEEVKDASELNEIIKNNVVSDMLTIIFEHNIKNSALQGILNKLALDYNKNVDLALCKTLWVSELGDLTAKKVSELKNA